MHRLQRCIPSKKVVADGFVESIGTAEYLPIRYQEGYNAGYAAGRAEASGEYDRGYNAGYTAGRNSMSGEYTKGYNKGYADGLAAGKASATANLQLWYIPGQNGTYNGNAYAARWDAAGKYTATKTISVSGAIKCYGIIAYSSTASGVNTSSQSSVVSPLTTLASGGSFTFQTKHIIIKVSRSGTTLTAEVDCHRTTYEASAGTWQINAHQVLVYA